MGCQQHNLCPVATAATGAATATADTSRHSRCPRTGRSAGSAPPPPGAPPRRCSSADCGHRGLDQFGAWWSSKVPHGAAGGPPDGPEHSLLLHPGLVRHAAPSCCSLLRRRNQTREARLCRVMEAERMGVDRWTRGSGAQEAHQSLQPREIVTLSTSSFFAPLPPPWVSGRCLARLPRSGQVCGHLQTTASPPPAPAHNLNRLTVGAPLWPALCCVVPQWCFEDFAGAQGCAAVAPRSHCHWPPATAAARPPPPAPCPVQ